MENKETIRPTESKLSSKDQLIKQKINLKKKEKTKINLIWNEKRGNGQICRFF